MKNKKWKNRDKNSGKVSERERGREKTVCELPYKFIVQVNI